MSAVTRSGHRQNVNCVAVTPEVVGRPFVLSGSDDTAVKVWRGNKCVSTINAHEGSVRKLAALPDGARFISVSVDCTAKLWKIDSTGKSTTLHTFQVGLQVLSVAALSDDQFVVGLASPTPVSDDVDNHRGRGDIVLYHVNGKRVHSFLGHTDDVNDLAVTRDDQGRQYDA